MDMLNLKDRVNFKRVYIAPLIEEAQGTSIVQEPYAARYVLAFKEVYIAPLIDEGLLAMTEPDNPTSRNQMYITVKAEKL